MHAPLHTGESQRSALTESQIRAGVFLYEHMDAGWVQGWNGDDALTSMSHACSRLLHPSQVGDYELAYAEGELKIAYDQSGLPLLDSIPRHLSHGHPAVFLGEVKFSELKRLLNTHGISAEFYGGVLVCEDGMINVRKISATQIAIKGAISPVSEGITMCVCRCSCDRRCTCCMFQCLCVMLACVHACPSLGVLQDSFAPVRSVSDHLSACHSASSSYMAHMSARRTPMSVRQCHAVCTMQPMLQSHRTARMHHTASHQYTHPFLLAWPTLLFHSSLESVASCQHACTCCC